MTKQELETKVNELELTLNAVELNAKCIKDDLAEANEKLANINKPKLTSQQADLIYEAIEIAAENYDFSDTNQYDFDFGLDYDGRVYIDNMQFNDYSGLAEEIYKKVVLLFNTQNTIEND